MAPGQRLCFNLVIFISFLLVIVFPPQILFAQQQPNSSKQLINSLLKVNSQHEQATLLLRNKELLTNELIGELDKKANDLKLKSDYREALKAYNLLQEIAAQLNNKNVIADAVNNIGEINRLTGKYDVALENYQKALKFSTENNHHAGIAQSWTNIGKIEYFQGNFRKALEYLNKGYDLNVAIGDKPAIASNLNIKGLILDALGDLSEAMESFQLSLQMYEEMGDKTTTAIPMNNIARLLSLHGDYDAARSYLEKTLILFKESEQKVNVGSTIMNIGNLYFDQGNYRLALPNYLKGLEIYQQAGDQFGATDALTNIAGVYQAQGNYDLALENFQKALKQYESLNAKSRTAIVMTDIGSLYSLKGENDIAIRFLSDSLKIRNAVGDVEGKATTLAKIGFVYSSAKKYSLAMEYYEKSLKISEEMNDIEKLARVTFLMAKDYQAMGEYVLANEFAERSYSAAAKISNPDLIWQARTISGNAYMAQQDFTNAQKSFNDAISAIETLRLQIAGGEQETQRFFELRTAPYYAMVKLLINQNKFNEALNYAERAKGRVVLDILQTGKINVTKAMTSEEEQQEKKLNLELASINKQIYNENLNEKPNPTLLSDLKLNLEKLRLKQDAFRTALYAAHPELQAQRGEVSAVTLEKESDLLPDHSTALMEFVVTDEKTYLFVLIPASRANGSSSSLILDVYTIPESDRSLAKRIEIFRNQLATRVGFRNSAQELFDLLVKPAQKDLKDKTNLVIVPDGALWQLPFQALMKALDRYLVEDYAISFSPSLSFLSEMLKLKREEGTGMSLETLLAIGNPLLGKATSDDEKLIPLPEAEKEVKGIAKLYGSDSRVFTGAEAVEDRMKHEASNYDVLHIATHGILNDKSPMYSHLVLSQSADSSKEDGLLEAWEIMKMDLRANIAVLSACDTARGKIGSGEGVIGLTWAFFVAGSPATVVSQWEVESASTSELMLAFHKNLKKTKLSAAKALQQAELKLLRSDEYRHPFYWAPFVVIGAGF